MNPNEYKIYRKFQHKEHASAYAELLRENGIDLIEEEYQNNHDVSHFYMPNSNAPKEYILRIKDSDRKKVDALLLNEERKKVESADKDHYLYDFNNEELVEVIVEYEKWSEYDYLLAQKILKERGSELSAQEIGELQNERISQLAQPHKGSAFLITMGYVLAICGGVLGIAIGYNLAYHKQTLPNHQSVYFYTPATRTQGTIILCIGILSVMATGYLISSQF